MQNGPDDPISLKVLAKIDFARIGFSGRFSRSERPSAAKIELICPSPTGQVVEFGGVKMGTSLTTYAATFPYRRRSSELFANSPSNLASTDQRVVLCSSAPTEILTLSFGVHDQLRTLGPVSPSCQILILRGSAVLP